ncbi:GNAT family N-acetyltransferase [Roseateles chitosanitabidus]|uniref:GNAT family N-acetyltransferase n=1 Tax=Roseateles chitosanitabidus TaxID=65048 RepID=UPI0009FF9F16|nr:GNAT family N-acetyltransferase [Roseateles chitosanitabidus]
MLTICRIETFRGEGSMEERGTSILVEPVGVAAFLNDVVAAADADRNALGFFPDSVYGDYCRRQQLFIATVDGDDTRTYGGHLLFDVTFPKAHVRQIHVAAAHRGRRVGAALLNELKTHLTQLGFISIHARVAEDLVAANGFWNGQGFYPQRLELGGMRKNRTIVVRAHELNTPQLFERSGITAADPLGLDIGEQRTRPLYLLDLNVLFDLGPRRERHRLAMDVFKAERMQICSLAISSEIEVELRRTAKDAKTDPMLSFASTFARFPVPESDVLDRLLPRLVELVFPDRAGAGTLNANDLSDLRHLATAVHCALPGLITNDETILNSAPALRREFGVDAISPKLFQAPLDEHEERVVHGGGGNHLITVELASDRDVSEVRELLTEVGVEVPDQVGQWAATGDDAQTSACVRLVARCGSEIVGYVAWPVSLHGAASHAHMAVSERRPGARESAQALLHRLADSVPAGGVALIHLSCPPRQAELREVAAAFGYTASPSASTELMKIAIKDRLRPANWTSVQQQLKRTASVVLPEAAPDYRHVDQAVPVVRPDGERAWVPIFQLESLLAPALLCLPGRAGVMVPIRRRFEEQLLAQSPQMSFLPLNKSQLTPQRHYLSGRNTLKSFERGDLLFFYESLSDRGSGSVVAMGRVLRAYHQEESSFQPEDLLASALSEGQLSEIGSSTTKTITVFDNVMRFPKPVSLRELEMLGCGRPQQLLTAQRLSPAQVTAILEKGFQ